MSTTEVSAVISDFGGVLTNPVRDGFSTVSERTGVSLEMFGQAIAALTAALGHNPIAELETGRMREADFIAGLSRELSAVAGRDVDAAVFAEAWFGGMAPNDRFIAFVRELHDEGRATAICTNNVREWSARWRAMIPIEEVFDVVVDSSEVGARKPEPRIYEVTLRELGVAPAAAVFVDDVAENCDAARALGIHAVHFQDTDQAIAGVRAALARP